MNEAGVLGRFVPEFGTRRVDDAVQHVPPLHGGRAPDPHRRRAVRHRARRARPSRIRCRPRSSRPSSTAARSTWRRSCTTSPRGAPRTTRSSGARIARTLCPRFGLSAAETETVAWLVEQHLPMSEIAFSRDIGDPKTIRDFADIVQSPERLKLLLVLTVADIRAVGPGVWNGWKGQLLRALYYETEPVVAGGHTQLAARERIAAAQAAFRARRRRLAAGRRSSASSSGTIPTTGCAPTRARSWSTPSWCARAERAGEKLASRLHHRRLHRHHRAVAVRAQPPAPAGAVRRRLRRRRRQHLGRPHLHHARRLRARHLPAGARVRAGRGRAASRPAHRRDHREAAARARPGSAP